MANEIQRHLVEETRLGIPAVIHEEVCAGLMARGATVFPQPIGLASTWDPSLIERMASVVRAEMRAIGAHQGLSPVLDVCRDPRWGRIEETFGEDPHLVAMMGNAFVRGLQGETLGDGVVANVLRYPTSSVVASSPARSTAASRIGCTSKARAFYISRAITTGMAVRGITRWTAVITLSLKPQRPRRTSRWKTRCSSHVSFFRIR